MIKCKKCKLNVKATDKFCSNCGSKIFANDFDVIYKQSNSKQDNSSLNKTSSILYFQKVFLLVLILIPTILLTSPKLFYNLHKGDERLGELSGYIYHNLTTSSSLFLGFISIGILFFFFLNLIQKNYLSLIVFLANGIYIIPIINLPELSRSYFSIVDLNGKFFLNQESLIYGILIIVVDIVYILKMSK